MKALEINGLKKTYDNDYVALDGVNLTVDKGDFFALLGPNGAGKSTTIGIISSLINATAGTVKVHGHNLSTQRNQCKLLIGLVPQEINFNVFESPLNILVTQAGYYGIPKAVALERAGCYLKLLDLWDKKDRPAREMSGGMKRRLMIARALVHKPSVLILDEPTAGVDIEIRRAMWSFLEDINRDGTTIILTTHYLEEAETLCRHVAIIDDGRIIEQGQVGELLSRSQFHSFVFDLQQAPDEPPQLQGFRVTRCEGTRLDVEVPLGDSLNALFEQLGSLGIQVVSMRNKTNRLEEFFLRLVGGDDRQESE